MVTSEQHLYQTIVLPRKLATGSIHDYLFCYCPLVGILFKVLRIDSDGCLNRSLPRGDLYGKPFKQMNVQKQ